MIVTTVITCLISVSTFTSVHISNKTVQSSRSGKATSSNNVSTGNVRSGSASNTSSSNITVRIYN